MTPPIVQLEALFKALADATRLRILGLLQPGEVCVCHIHESLGIPQSKASRHLAYLRRTGLVATRKDGQWVYYRLAESGGPLADTVRQVVAQALGPVDVIRGDARRLQRKAGSCAATPAR